MSTSETVVTDNDINEYDLDEAEAKTPVYPYQQALELGSLALALAGLLLLFGYGAQTYTAVNAQASANPTNSQILRFLAGLIIQPILPIMALLSISLAAVVRGVWRNERSRDRTVFATTIALLVAFIVAAAAVTDTIYTLFQGSAQFGETAAAKFTGVITNVASLVIAGIALAIGFVFAASRTRTEDDQIIDTDETVTDAETKADPDAASAVEGDTHYKA